MVMGILILSGAYSTGELFSNNEFIRYMFGAILVVYGIFRAYNAYVKMRYGGRKFRYYDSEEE
jgi:hypothetical protein